MFTLDGLKIFIDTTILENYLFYNKEDKIVSTSFKYEILENDESNNEASNFLDS